MSEALRNASTSSSSSLNSSFQDTEDDQTIATILAEEENLHKDGKLAKRLSHLDSIPTYVCISYSSDILEGSLLFCLFHGLPNGFLERVSKLGQGKVVAWAPQLQVLQHKAVGLYLTHCGWNSTMEAIQCRNRLLCYLVSGDQFVNYKYIVKVWRIGVKVGGFGQKDVEEALRKAEDGEMKERLEKLYERTMGDEASSRVAANLKAFLLDSITKQFTKSLKNVEHYNL